MPKIKDTLVDSHVSLKQCKLAIEALYSHSSKQEQKAAETELLPGKEQHVWLQLAVKKMQPEKKFKPFKIPVAHPLVDPRTSAVCLITKDPQREYKDLLETHGIKFISRVVGVMKLKGKFKPYEARRMLLKENEMFLADERVIPLLPGLLGSKWFDAKKQPIPVCLTRKDLKGELERAISSTYMHQNQGTCTSIKIATTAQTPAQALANLEKALPAIVENIKGGWENVQSLHLKTNDSVALPIWTCGLEDGKEGRWDGLVAGVEAEGDEMVVDEVEEVEAETEAKGKGKTKGKGAKRPSEEAAQDEEKPKKKAKSAAPADAETAPVGPSEVAPVDTNSKKKARKPKTPTPATETPAAAAPTPETPAKSDLPAVDSSESAPADSTSLKKKRRKSKTTPVATTESPSAAAPTLETSTQPEPVAVPIPEPAPTAVTSASTAEAPTKKSKKQAASDVATAPAAEVEPVASPALTTDESGKKKRQKRKADAVVAEPTPAVVVPVDVAPVPVVETVEALVNGEKKKRKKKSKAAAEPAAVSPEVDELMADLTAPVEVETTAVPATADKPRKKSRVSFSEVVDSSPAPTFITKEELKQKRSAVSGEKKKGKVVKGSAKSAKDGILGRKAARS